MQELEIGNHREQIWSKMELKPHGRQHEVQEVGRRHKVQDSGFIPQILTNSLWTGTLLDPEHLAMNQTKPLPWWVCLLKRNTVVSPYAQFHFPQFQLPAIWKC